MNTIDKIKYNISTCMKCFFSFILIFGLISCSEYKDAPFGNTTNTTGTGDNPFSDPDEVDIVSVDMTASIDYSSVDNLVTCYINVIDQSSNFIDSMFPDNFEIITNSIIITSDYRTLEIIESSTNMVGLILDSSGSMYGDRMTAAKIAAKMFVDTMSGSDETAVIDFDDSARLTQALTTDKQTLKDAIDTLEAEGSTNIGDGIIECANSIGSRPGKTAGILLTDGEDNGGVIDQGIQQAVSLSMPVYSIFMGEDITATARSDMQRIADDTGGIYYEVLTAAELQNVFSSVIPQALAARPSRKSYVITFENQYPSYSYVGVLFTLKYFNAWGLHTTDFAAMYYVAP
jgi:hypothetical protein